MRNEIELTDDQIIEKFDDLFSISVEMDEMILTRDPLQSFLDARKDYSDAGKLVIKKDDHIEVDGVQAQKGTPRKTLRVIDFGTVRIAILS